MTNDSKEKAHRLETDGPRDNPNVSNNIVVGPVVKNNGKSEKTLCAETLVRLGYNLIPGKADKTPRDYWKRWQTERITAAQYQEWFAGSTANPITWLVLTGATPYSDIPGLVCVDADDAEAMELVRTRCPATPLTTQARSDGCHYWYRRLETTEKVKSRNRTRIGGHIYKLDIKADGGYAVAPGNEHWAGGRYTWSMPWTRELIESLPVYDPSWLPHEEKAREKWEQGEVGRGGANRPGDDFNRRALWDTILEPAGWTYAGGNKWCRPGGFGHSANILGDDDDYLYVWSSNAKPFEAEQAYSKFAAYTVLYHNGNWSRAAEILAEEGYGAVDEARIEEMVEPLVAMESTPPTPPPAAAPASEKKKGATTVQKLMALGGLAAYYHDATETAYASFVVNEHRENWRVRSSIFRR